MLASIMFNVVTKVKEKLTLGTKTYSPIFCLVPISMDTVRVWGLGAQGAHLSIFMELYSLIAFGTVVSQAFVSKRFPLVLSLAKSTFPAPCSILKSSPRVGYLWNNRSDLERNRVSMSRQRMIKGIGNNICIQNSWVTQRHVAGLKVCNWCRMLYRNHARDISSVLPQSSVELLFKVDTFICRFHPG